MIRIFAMAVFFTLYLVVIGYAGYILCFEDRHLGGWIPFLLIVGGPFVGAGIMAHFLAVSKEYTS